MVSSSIALTQFNVSVGRHHNVQTFQVPVYNVVGVQIVQRLQELYQNSANVSNRKDKGSS